MERPRSLQRTDGPVTATVDQGRDATRDLPRDAAGTTTASTSGDRIDYSQGVRGTILAQGTRPYLDRPGAAESPYVRLQLENGRSHDVWGVGVAKALADQGVKTGDTVTLSSTRSEPVTITTRDPVTNAMSEKQGSRRAWEAQDIQRGTGTATGTTTGTTAGHWHRRCDCRRRRRADRREIRSGQAARANRCRARRGLSRSRRGTPDPRRDRAPEAGRYLRA